MSSSNPTLVDEGKETMNSDPSGVSNDRSSAEKKKAKKRARDQPQVATEAKGEVDSQSVDEPEATEGTSSSAPPPSKRWTKSLVTHLQAENEKLKHALGVAQRIRKNDKLAPHESSSEEENSGGTLGLNDHDSDPGMFDNNVNPEMTRSPWGTVDRSEGRGLHQRQDGQHPPQLKPTRVVGLCNVHIRTEAAVHQ